MTGLLKWLNNYMICPSKNFKKLGLRYTYPL